MTAAMIDRGAWTAQRLARLLELGYSIEISRTRPALVTVSIASDYGAAAEAARRYYDGGTLDACLDQIPAAVLEGRAR